MMLQVSTPIYRKKPGEGIRKFGSEVDKRKQGSGENSKMGSSFFKRDPSKEEVTGLGATRGSNKIV